MFSDIAIGREYDWIESNVDLATPDPMHQFSQILDRIQVSKITPGMIIPILSFTQDPPTYDNIRSHIPAVYASIPDTRLGVTNMALIYANQLFTDWDSYPKCLTFEFYAEDAKYTLLVFSQLAISAQLYDPVITGKLQMAAVMPVAPSTNINIRAASFHMAMNGALIEKSSTKYAEEWLQVRRVLHGDKAKIAAYMAGEVDPWITSPKLMTKIRNSSLMPARLANLLIMQAGLLVKILTMNFCMVIDWIGTGNKTPDAAHLCMFYPAPASLNAAAVAYHEFKTSLEIKDAVENFRLILMDMFQESVGCQVPFFVEIFELMKSQLLDEGPDSIHHVNIDYQIRGIEAQTVEFAKLYTNGDNEHMDFEEFKALNKRTLRIDTGKWMDDYSRLDRCKIPKQVVRL